MKNEQKNDDFLNTTLQEILDFIGVKPSVTITPQDENIVSVDIQGNNLNFLIGFKGESLNALQSLLNLIAFKKSGKPAIISVDINNYKGKKTERIVEIAKSFIDKVRFFEKEVALPPMTSWERRHVHLLVSEYTDVESESVGEGVARRVVLKPKKK